MFFFEYGLQHWFILQDVRVVCVGLYTGGGVKTPNGCVLLLPNYLERFLYVSVTQRCNTIYNCQRSWPRLPFGENKIEFKHGGQPK